MGKSVKKNNKPLTTRASAAVAGSELNTEDIPITVDALKAVMPKRQKHNITNSLVAELNQVVTDPEYRDSFRDNLYAYTTVLSEPNVKLANYVNAVKYVSFKLMGNNNQESWIKTFPVRYQRLITQKKDAGFIRSTVACYNRNKIVNAVWELTMIPAWVYNQDLHQKALNTQAELMMSADSEKVRTEAANSLLTHLKMPEVSQVSLDINIKEDDSIRQLREVTLELSAQQRKMIDSGAMTADDVAGSKLIEGECERVD